MWAGCSKITFLLLELANTPILVSHVFRSMSPAQNRRSSVSQGRPGNKTRSAPSSRGPYGVA